MPRVEVRKLGKQSTKTAQENQRAVQSATPGADPYAELEALRQEIGERWQSDKTAVELISDGRC